jgi:hypothetical protein
MSKALSAAKYYKNNKASIRAKNDAYEKSHKKQMNAYRRPPSRPS